jgi:hypothetical protein
MGFNKVGSGSNYPYLLTAELRFGDQERDLGAI